MKIRSVFALLAWSVLLAGIGMTACTSPGGSAGGSDGDADLTDGGGGPGTADQTGTLRVLVTDKPFPFEFIDQALVTVTRVEARRGGDGDDDHGNENESDEGNENGAETNDDDTGNENEDEDDEGNENDAETNDNDDDTGNENEDDEGNENDADGNDHADDEEDDDGDEATRFEVLFEGERTFDLKDLQNGRTDLLAEAELPVGTYTQLRLVVTEGQVTLSDDREFSLRVPSGEQSGIKLRLTFDVQAEAETVLLLDVDLSRAFSPIPGGKIDNVEEIREFRFSPSLAMRLIELADTGSISGTVTDTDANPILGASVTAFDAETEVTSTATDADGAYALSGLAAGTYRVEFSATGFEDAEVADLVVEVGEALEGVDTSMTPKGVDETAVPGAE